MGNKNVYVDRGGKTPLRVVGADGSIKDKRKVDINGIHVFDSSRIYNSQMGEAAKILINIFGLTGLFFGFISNISVAPYISLAIGVISTAWAFFKMMKMWEDWRYRRAERRQKEHETDNKLNHKRR